MKNNRKIIIISEARRDPRGVVEPNFCVFCNPVCVFCNPVKVTS